MEYVVIVGASLANLGAESMTCIAVEMAKREYPDAEIILATTDERSNQLLSKQKMKSYCLPLNEEKTMGKAFYEFVKGKINAAYDPNYENILKSTRWICDVSGFVFTTEFGISSVYAFLNTICAARSYGIPLTIMQQSYGPISIEDLKTRLLTTILMWGLLKYPTEINAREKAGFKLLRRYTKKNLYLKPDMVLLHKNDINYSLLRKKVNLCGAAVGKDAVAIIPNVNILEKTSHKKEYVQCLDEIVAWLQDKGKRVYFVCHCRNDKTLCLEEAEKWGLEIIDCTEGGAPFFMSVIEKFDYIISSRYHSIVHAYRASVPAIIIGWADKYCELAELMGQEDYIIDFRENVNREDIMRQILLMEEKYGEEAKKVHSRIQAVQQQYK